MNANVYELAARRDKVAKMLAAVPLATSVNEREALAVCLEQATPAARAQFAAKLGVNKPTSTTWAQLIDAVRARPLATEAEVRAAAAARRAG